jgi:hypothetical protein
MNHSTSGCSNATSFLLFVFLLERSPSALVAHRMMKDKHPQLAELYVIASAGTHVLNKYHDSLLNSFTRSNYNDPPTGLHPPVKTWILVWYNLHSYIDFF